ncbi:hypothetical protein [Spiroplasma endosymbiont of Nebria brevicollis]|uniref:hypothetical protein n=1 Tax=Spiroplasma endosymbiont of Nebria brevicollis TaxID=3066284 RepID=UPI00313EFA28
MKNNEIRMTTNMKQIYLLMYKTNQSDDMKYKAFETLELATLFHLGFKEVVTKIGYPNREIIHYQILAIPFNLEESKILNASKEVK